MRILIPATICLLLLTLSFASTDVPDIRSVEPDLEIPPVSEGTAAAGQRVRESLPNWNDTDVHHITYLPNDYQPGRTYPVIIELAGNGGYRSPQGDESTGLPDGSKLGYGLSGGNGFIWVCLPYVSGDGNRIAVRWWGDAPDYDPEPTLKYLKEAVPWICDKYGGDPDRVVLAGFSRGAIACNFLGLHDDNIAGLWCGFFTYSHYDGVHKWEYPGSDRMSALERLKRLQNRPQFICHEGTDERALNSTQAYLEATQIEGDFTFCGTGFRNHADAWTLRPSAARKKARQWLMDVTSE